MSQLAFSAAFEHTILVVIAIAVICLAVLTRWRSNQLPYPPGPRPDFFIGNIRQMMDGTQEQTFKKWGKIYGDVNYAKVFRQQFVILNSFKAAKDLLEKRGAIYSSRPKMPLVIDLMGWGDPLVYQDSGAPLRIRRRVLQEKFSSQSLAKFIPLQMKEVYTTLLHMGNAPDKFEHHLKRFSAAMIFNMAYGYPVHSHDDKLVVIADQVTLESVSVGPAAKLVNFFPILKYVPTWMPFAGFKRRALHIRGLVNQLFDIPLAHVKAQMDNGTAPISIAGELLENLQSHAGSKLPSGVLDDKAIRFLLGILTAAATDTTDTTLVSFLLLMVLHEDVFKKAQAEIDQKIGNDRLVNADDKELLPYFACILKEVLRWTCPIPLGIPHRLTDNDEYRNQFIPYNSSVIANLWGMTRNEEMYPEPEKFMPERFVGRMNEDAATQVAAVFGFGRRVCPGRGFAESNMFLLLANFTAIFSIEKALDGGGKPIIPSTDFTPGIVRRPKLFPCKITYRSEKAKELVAHANLMHN